MRKKRSHIYLITLFYNFGHIMHFCPIVFFSLLLLNLVSFSYNFFVKMHDPPSYRMEQDWKPKKDTVFDAIDDAWKFWVDYGGRVGFGVRKLYTHRKKDGSPSSCRFVCNKEGVRKPDKRDYKTVNPRQETRTNCNARLGLLRM